LASALDNMARFPFAPGSVQYTKPALFVRGTRSKYVADETIPLIGEFFPKFQVRDVEAGHWRMCCFSILMRDFLSIV